MLVLPRIGRPAARSRRDHGGVVRRHPALEDPRAARGRAGPRVASTSLTAIGTPSSARRGVAGRAARVGRGGLRERALGVDVQERVHGAVDRGDPVEVGLGQLDARWSRRRPARRPARPRSWRVRSRHCSSPRIRGTREPLLLGAGRAGERLLGGQAGHHDVLAEDVGQRQRVRGRRDVVAGDAADRGDRLEDHAQLGREVVELGVGQVDPGEVGQVRDLVAA